MADTVELPELSTKILNCLAKVTRASHRALRESLGVSDDEYTAAKDALLQSRKAVSMRCRGGGLKLPERVELPSLNEAALEAARKTQEATEVQGEAAAEKAEKDLYPYVRQWAVNAGHDTALIVGDNHRRESWENPDILAITTNPFEWLVGADIEITTVEVKLSFEVKGLWQAAHYRNFSHYVYLACYESPEILRAKTEGRLYEMAVEMGLGIISLTPAGAGARGVKCVEINSPTRQTPRPTEVDSLLSDYADVLLLERPGRRVLAQMQSV